MYTLRRSNYLKGYTTRTVWQIEFFKNSLNVLDAQNIISKWIINIQLFEIATGMNIQTVCILLFKIGMFNFCTSWRNNIVKAADSAEAKMVT